MKKKSKKRYWFSVVEEMIQNPKFQHFRGGRIEVYDRKNTDPGGYAIYEARFLIPKEFIMGFRDLFDGAESNRVPYIVWDIKEFERKKSISVPTDLKKEFCHTDYNKIKPVIADGTQGMRRGE